MLPIPQATLLLCLINILSPLSLGRWICDLFFHLTWLIHDKPFFAANLHLSLFGLLCSQANEPGLVTIGPQSCKRDRRDLETKPNQALGYEYMHTHTHTQPKGEGRKDYDMIVAGLIVASLTCLLGWGLFCWRTRPPIRHRGPVKTEWGEFPAPHLMFLLLAA